MSKSNMISILINSNKILNNSAGINTSKLETIIDGCFLRGYLPNDKIIIENILTNLLLKNNLSPNIGHINYIIDKLTGTPTIGSLDTLRFIADKISFFEITGEREIILKKISDECVPLQDYISFIKDGSGVKSPPLGATSPPLGATSPPLGATGPLGATAGPSGATTGPSGSTSGSTPGSIPVKIEDIIPAEYYSFEIKNLMGYYNKIECRFIAFYVDNSKDKNILVIEKKNNIQSEIKLKSYPIKKIKLDTIKKIPYIASKFNYQKIKKQPTVAFSNYLITNLSKKTNQIVKVKITDSRFLYVYVPSVTFLKRAKGYHLYKDFYTTDSYEGFKSLYGPRSGPVSGPASGPAPSHSIVSIKSMTSFEFYTFKIKNEIVDCRLIGFFENKILVLLPNNTLKSYLINKINENSIIKKLVPPKAYRTYTTVKNMEEYLKLKPKPFNEIYIINGLYYYIPPKSMFSENPKELYKDYNRKIFYTP